MTDKQIIIDGVDVAGCAHYGSQENCTIRAHQKCSNYPNCYYKQLARKTQEYKNLSDLIRNTETYLVTCDRCKDEILIYPSISGRTNYTDNEVDTDALKSILYQLEAKTQECDELKKKLMQKSDIDMFFNTPIEGWSNDPCGVCEYKAEYPRCRKAMENIQDYCIHYLRHNPKSPAIDLNEILNIIYKLEGEENAEHN